MAIIILPCAQEFRAQAKIHGQIGEEPPVVLRKNGVVLLPVFVIVNPASAKAEFRGPLQKILKIGQRGGGGGIGVGKEKLPVEHLWEFLVQIDRSELAPETPGLVAVNPAQGFHKIEVVLCLVLVSRRCGAKLEPGSPESELVDAIGQIICRAVNADIGRGYRVHVDGTVVDMHITEAEIVHQRRRKQVRLRNGEDAVMHGKLVRKIEIRGTRRSPERSLQTSGAERQVRLKICVEKARRNLVVVVPELAVPTPGELVVGEFAGLADGERSKIGLSICGQGISGQSRIKVSIGGSPKLVALYLEQSIGDWIDTRNPESGCQLRCRQTTQTGWNNWNRRADEGSGGIAAALPGSLIIRKEESELGIATDRPSQASAEDVLLDDRTLVRLSVAKLILFQEVFIRSERGVTEKLVHIAVEGFRSRLENGVDVAAAIASLCSIVKRRLDLELLDHVRIGKRCGGQLGDVVVGGANAFNQVVIVVFALPVHKDSNVPAAQLRRRVQFALRAGGERQQLLEVLRCQGKAANRFGFNYLTRSSSRGFHLLHFRLDFYLLLLSLRTQLRGDAGSLRDADIDARKGFFGKPAALHANGVNAHGQELRTEATVRIGLHRADSGTSALVDDLDLSARDHGAGDVLHGARNGAGCAALGENLNHRYSQQNPNQNQTRSQFPHTPLPVCEPESLHRYRCDLTADCG